MDSSAKPPSMHVQLAEAENQERQALSMAKSLERLGAPARDVKYALDRAEAAKAKKLQLRRMVGPERPR